MSHRTLGMRIEDLHCYGFADGEKLSQQERADIVEFARRFEECSYTIEELRAMDDKALVAAAFGAMAEYAMGQI